MHNSKLLYKSLSAPALTVSSLTQPPQIADIPRGSISTDDHLIRQSSQLLSRSAPIGSSYLSEIETAKNHILPQALPINCSDQPMSSASQTSPLCGLNTQRYPHFSHDKKLQIATNDGKKLNGRLWQANPNTLSNNVLIVFHGMGEHSGCYQGLAETLQKDGVDTLAFDFRGHGLSTGRRGVIRSYNALHTDTQAILNYVKKQYPQAQINLMGHSMGGGLLLNHLLKFSDKLKDLHINSIIATNPWLTLNKQPTFMQRWLFWAIGSLHPSYAINMGKHLVASPDRSPKKDLLCHAMISPNLFLGAESAGLKNIKDACAFPTDLRAKTTIMHTPTDLITSPQSSEFFAHKAGINYKQLPNMDHTPHVTSNRYKFYNIISKHVDDKSNNLNI